MANEELEKIMQILEYWGLSNSVITPITQDTQNVWDIEGIYILKKFRSAEDLSSCSRFSELLASHNIPVAIFKRTLDGDITPPDELYCLMTKLPGLHLNFYENPEPAIEAGRGLALLHNTLLDIEKITDSYDSNLPEDWRSKIKPCLKNISEDIVETIDKKLSEVYPLLPRQLIHRDFHPQNILFDGDHISGWLDFDLCHRNVRIFDIAYFLAGLVIGNINDPAKIDIWNKIYRNLLNGYNEVSPLSDDEISAIPIIMIVIELLFVWYWNEQDNTKEKEVALNVALWLWNESVSV